MFVIGAVLLWRESRLDWFILALFPLEWVAYDWMHGADQWWSLWTLSGMQLIAAGPWHLIDRLTNHFHGDTAIKQKVIRNDPVDGRPGIQAAD